jgi:hypothetical protein
MWDPTYAQRKAGALGNQVLLVLSIRGLQKMQKVGSESHYGQVLRVVYGLFMSALYLQTVHLQI